MIFKTIITLLGSIRNEFKHTRWIVKVIWLSPKYLKIFISDEPIMMNRTIDRRSEKQSHPAQISVTHNPLLVQEYLQRPFSISWSKLSGLCEAEGLSN